MNILKQPVTPADHQQGNINAAITLIEYGDFECPYCGRAHPLVKRLLKEMPDDIHFIFRNFPLTEIHPYAYASAVAAEAAGKQNKFWEMHDLIYENQEKLNTAYLLTLAENLQINMKQFALDMKSKETERKVEMDFEGGIRSGVNGTPTFFLNGNRLSTYNETYKSLHDAVLLELEVQQH